MTRQEKITAIIAMFLFAIVALAHDAFGQFARYTTRPLAGASNCATGDCPTAARPVASAPTAKLPVGNSAPSASQTGESENKETKIIEPAVAEPGVPADAAEAAGVHESPDSTTEEWETPNVNSAVESASELGEITLVYPATAQSNDEVVAFAARRAREPVAEDGEPLDTETPIGSIRNVGARLKELTSAIEAQQKALDALASSDGGGGAILEAIKKKRESDEGFQRDAREGIASVLAAVKKQNETFIGEQVKKAVAPAPETYWKWVAIALVGLTILVVWFIFVVKIIGWFIALGKSSISRVVESALTSVRASKNEASSSDEIKL